jgi:hypothetical protein
VSAKNEVKIVYSLQPKVKFKGPLSAIAKLFAFGCSVLLLSCSTLQSWTGSTPDEEKPPASMTLQKKYDELSAKYIELKQEHEVSVKQLQRHEALLLSLRDSFGQAQKDTLSAQRTKRSGISKKIAEFESTENLAFVPSSREVLKWKNEPENLAPLAGSMVPAPNDIYEEALAKFERGAPGEALLLLLQLHSQYSLRSDAGASRLLEAKCYLKIKDFRKAVASIKFFKVNYATSALLANAYLVQAEAHKNLREFSLAGNVLKDVVSLQANSEEAKVARAELAKLRELQTQRTTPEEEGAF